MSNNYFCKHFQMLMRTSAVQLFYILALVTVYTYHCLLLSLHILNTAGTL